MDKKKTVEKLYNLQEANLLKTQKSQVLLHTTMNLFSIHSRGWVTTAETITLYTLADHLSFGVCI